MSHILVNFLGDIEDIEVSPDLVLQEESIYSKSISRWVMGGGTNYLHNSIACIGMNSVKIQK